MHFIEIIKEVRGNGPKINELLKTPLNLLEDDCIDQALLVAVENGSCSSVGKLILRGATNIDPALEESRRLQHVLVTAFLLVIKAAMTDDRVLVLKLYGEHTRETSTLIIEDNLIELQNIVRNSGVKTVVPIEIARRHKSLAVREELLLRTDVDKEKGTVLWFGLHLKKIEISWLKKVYWVQELKLACNELTSLPSEMGNYLKQCTKLDIQRNRIREIPQCILELPSITELNLSHNNLVDIPNVPEWSISLAVLDLSYNHLNNLPNSAIAPALKSLNISNNQFYAVPHCVCSFITLRTLNIANNPNITNLPPELGRLQDLHNLNLDGLNNLTDPPRSVRVSTADCIRYLNSRLLNTRRYYHMKLMVVGKQAIGKSTIVARLCNKKLNDEFTVGVDITEWKYSPAYNKKTFHFSVWDFASQEEYCATHQCFLSKRSLYLLLWNVTEGDAGVADLKPWLDSISVRASNSCLIIVGTYLDKVSKEDRESGKIDDLMQKVEELTKQYHQLVIAKITVVGLEGSMENVADLKDHIYNAAAEYKIKDQYVMGQQIPSSYHALDAKLSTIHRLVKDGQHKPIMHAAEFKEMVKSLNLVSIQDDKELSTATHFLHEVGALFHYNDTRHNLDDLYFVDPSWLYELISTVVTRNPYVKNGILRSKNLSLLLEDRRYPCKYFNQYLALLSRFDIALPLDNDQKRILIPSMLPENRPTDVTKQQPDDRCCFKRFIIFHHTNSQDQYFRRPLGLWSCLLSRIMSSIREVKNMLSRQVPVEDENIATTDVTRYASPKSSVKRNTENGDLFDGKTSECNDLTLANGLQSVEDDTGSSLIYWRTGLFCKVGTLFFCVESLAQNPNYHDKQGILIVCSPTARGRNVLGQLIDIVELLISEWYPGLSSDLEQRVPCLECHKRDIANPCEFKIDQLLLLIANHKLTHECDANHKVQLIELVPDLLLADLDPVFLLDPDQVIYRIEKESLLGIGAFGEVYHGKYKNQAVAVKLYTARQYTKIEESFKELRAESRALQRLHHPCLVCMVGVTIHPTMSLVLEQAPLGALQTVLFRGQIAFMRIVLYRIAVQVASALRFLHSINIIFRDLNASNVLLWSLSPDHLINCKVSGFTSITYSGPQGARGLYGTKGFIAPEVTRVNHSKEHSTYDQQADIFSFGMFLYQLLACRQPFHNIQSSKVEAVIENGQRPQLNDVSVAETGFYYMSHVMKLCWAGNPQERPTGQQIVEWMSASALQFCMSVKPVNSNYSIRNGCIVTPMIKNKTDQVLTSSELWICCDGAEGAELSVLTTNIMEEVGKHFVKKNQVHCMKQCGEHVWVASRAGLECGVIDIFDKNTKNLVHNIKIKENAVSCITNSVRLVYMGTMEGYCFCFPLDVRAIQRNAKPHYKYVSEHSVDGLAVTQTCLWVSTCNQICFLNPETLDLEGIEKRMKNKNAFVGKLMLSDDEELVWSAHLGGVMMSAWDVNQRTHICDVDVGACAEEKCHIGDPRDRIMTAMCTALDTVWIGLANGFIMIFGMDPPGELLTYFRPYNSYIRFLSASKYPGPCQKEECMMLCGGKMYRPDDSFKELPDYEREDEKGEPVDTAGVAVLWEVLPARYTRQVQYLSKGISWLNYPMLKKAMMETGFTDSMSTKHCHPTPINSPTNATAKDESVTNRNSAFDYQQDYLAF